MPNELKSQSFAQGRVAAAGTVPLNFGTRNFTITHVNGTGIYVITWLGTQIDPLNSIVKLTARGVVVGAAATMKCLGVAAQVDASVTIHTSDSAGTASDTEFDFEVTQTQ